MSEPLRLLYVLPLYLPWLGGLEVLCSQLLGELRARGHEAAVLTAVNDRSTPLGEDVVDGVRVLRTDAYQFVEHGPAALLRTQAQVRAFVHDVGADVVHAHDTGPLLWLHQRSARGRAPLLVTLHVVTSRHVPDRLPLVRRLVLGADAVTGVSDDVVSDTLTFAPEVAGRVSTVANGAPAPPHPPAPVPDGPARLLCLGRLVQQKGFERALDALALLLRRRPEVRLDVAGTGPEEAALRQRADALGLGDRVRWLGRVDHADVPSLLATATAVVMPSRFEGLPLVALEAARAERPVVGTDVAGLRRAVVPAVTGLLVPEGDTAALAAALTRLVDDRDLARSLGRAARRHAESEHALSRCADAYEGLYRRLLADRRASAAEASPVETSVFGTGTGARRR